MKKLRIATRRSLLALTQTRWVARRLQEFNPGLEVEEVHVVTQGDKVQDKPLHMVGGKGLFVSEVEAYVARDEADIAVHSLKDVPGDIPLAEGMDLLCLPEREDPRDVLITREGIGLMDLTAGDRIGTTSLRRVSQLSVERPDLNYRTLRGNVDTRIERLMKGDFDAIVLAASGLNRLSKLSEVPHSFLEPQVCLPAVGQGTLAIEGRANREELRALLAPLEHDETRLVTEAERALLMALQGSCRVPMAGHATLEDGGHRIHLQALVADPEGKKSLHVSMDARMTARDQIGKRKEASALGEAVADALLQRGARQLMQEAEAAVLRSSGLN